MNSLALAYRYSTSTGVGCRSILSSNTWVKGRLEGSQATDADLNTDIFRGQVYDIKKEMHKKDVHDATSLLGEFI